MYLEFDKLCNDYYESSHQPVLFDYIHALIISDKWATKRELIHSGQLRRTFENHDDFDKEYPLLLKLISVNEIKLTKDEAGLALDLFLKERQGSMTFVLIDGMPHNTFDSKALINPQSYKNNKWTKIDTGNVKWIGEEFQDYVERLMFKDDETKKYYQGDGNEVVLKSHSLFTSM